jgi:peroxiredoxin
MLQFTASWCKVCHKEMPHIEREIWQKHKNNSRFALFGIDYKESEAAIADFVKTTGVTYPIVMDKNGSIFELYARPDAGITRNVVIDSTGKIVFLTRLFSQSEFDEMCRMIDQLLTDFSN